MDNLFFDVNNVFFVDMYTRNNEFYDYVGSALVRRVANRFDNGFLYEKIGDGYLFKTIDYINDGEIGIDNFYPIYEYCNKYEKLFKIITLDRLWQIMNEKDNEGIFLRKKVR